MYIYIYIQNQNYNKITQNSFKYPCYFSGFPGGSVVKSPPASAGDVGDSGSIPGLGRCPGGSNGNPLQYFCLENPMDGGAYQATVYRVAKSQAQLSAHTHTHTLL